MSYPFLSSNNFSPEEITELSVAYENACAAIHGASKSEALRERIAARVVSIAIGGERDATKIYLQCIKELAPVTSRMAEKRAATKNGIIQSS